MSDCVALLFKAIKAVGFFVLHLLKKKKKVVRKEQPEHVGAKLKKRKRKKDAVAAQSKH